MYSIHDIKSYDIEGKGLPSNVELKVRAIHIPALSIIEDNMPFYVKLYVSIKSAYRSKEWEKSKGRSGYSEHTFSNLGAVDVTCDNFHKNKDRLLQELIDRSPYTRIAVYQNFIHCDLKNSWNDSYVYNSKWVRQYKIER